MNNSIRKKIYFNYKNNLENTLSSTSSEFITKSNYNKKTIKQKVDNCSCKDLFEAIDDKNLKLILYILKENNCCFTCKNHDGNTAMHLLISFYEHNKEISLVIDDILNGNCRNFINIQNNKGQTPMLNAVMNNLNELAEKMENSGADPSIADNDGNFILDKSNDAPKNNDTIETADMEESSIENENKITQNIMNIFNLIVPKSHNDELTTLNLNEEEDFNDTDNFIELIKSKINSSIKNNSNKINNDSSTSSSSSEYIQFPKLKTNNQTSSDTLNTEKFIALLDSDTKQIDVVNYSSNDDDNTEQFIATLRNKYNSYSENDRTNNSSKQSKINDELVNDKTAEEQNNNTAFTKANQTESETSSDILNMANSDIEKIVNETTSVEQKENLSTSEEKHNSKYKVFLKNNNVNNDSLSEIDTDTLLKVMDKIQTKKIMESDKMVGGGISKQTMIGHRTLISDTENINSKKQYISEDYDNFYNNDSELGTKTKINELSRMMISQKEKLHNEVLETIMGMLNNGLLVQSNKPIDANEKNAKLIKAYIYRQISEKNPQMGGMDKILTFKTMNDNEIINMVKKMPNLDELEESIQKHIDNKKTITNTETSDEKLNKPKKSSKKSSKK